MAIRLHGSARTTPRIRAELQLATGSHRSLAKLYGINPKTVAKWRARTSVLDEPMGPRGRASQHLSQEQEHLAIALRKQGHLSLDDLMGQLLETAPKLSRSALHRCLQRHGISRQPVTQVPRRHGKFEETTLGFVHIDSAEMKVSSGKQHMFVAIDRITKFTHVAFFDRATKANAAQFLRQVLVAFLYRIHTVLTDNGMAFTGQERFRGGVTDTCIGHIFERICKFNGVEKRHTKPYNPWTNGMVERMNRTIKESTIKAYEYEGLEQLREHVQAFVRSYNFGKHLKALRWKTPFRAICEAWEKDPSRFRLHPHHLTVGLNILITGSGNSHIATLVERQSRFVMLVQVAGKDTASVVGGLTRQVQQLPNEMRKSLTWDRGTELAQHKKFTVATYVQVYFCDPKSPWQRGSDGNTNGLLRQYFPKGMNLAGYSQDQLNEVAAKLNARPRKTLCYKTPAEVFLKGVALTG